MSPHEFLLLIHLLLFVYWLGGDLGVFYSSRFVVNPQLTTESRLVAAKIMLGCDLIPRICMSLTLAVGGLLSQYLGVEHPRWQLGLIILTGPLWLSMVLVLHFRHHAPYIAVLTKLDFYFRWFVISAILASCIYAILTNRVAGYPWLIAKLLGFAILVFCGLMIRIQIKDFSATYLKLVQHTHTEDDNQRMIVSLSRVRPWVIAIWLLLILEAYLGVAKPSVF